MTSVTKINLIAKIIRRQSMIKVKKKNLIKKIMTTQSMTKVMKAMLMMKYSILIGSNKARYRLSKTIRITVHLAGLHLLL